ncbi:hypothetical protein evm_015157, partial [Chilo suppressalis]
NFVKWNLEWVWGECELAELDGDTLLTLLQQSDLVLHNEATLYHFAVRWLNKQRERITDAGLSEAEAKLHWETLVSDVFSHVRFPMMCPKQLAKLLLCPLTQEHKDFFMERMAIPLLSLAISPTQLPFASPDHTFVTLTAPFASLLPNKSAKEFALLKYGQFKR